MDEPKVLIVEDETPQRNVMRKWLDHEGYNCVEACDGVEALEQFEKYNGSIRLVVLDVMMPRMDGVELIKEIRTKSISTAPVIMCTGAKRDDLDDMDVFAIFKKPIDMKAFMEQVRKAFYFGKNQSSIMSKVKKLNTVLNGTFLL